MGFSSIIAWVGVFIVLMAALISLMNVYNTQLSDMEQFISYQKDVGDRIRTDFQIISVTGIQGHVEVLVENTGKTAVQTHDKFGQTCFDVYLDKDKLRTSDYTFDVLNKTWSPLLWDPHELMMLNINKTLIGGWHIISIIDCTGVKEITATMIVIPLTLEFYLPTELNGSTINQDWTLANITIVNAGEILDTFIFDWDGANYSVYDDDMVLAYNFNNNSALGENESYFVDISRYGTNGACNISGGMCPIYTSFGKYNGAYDFDGLNESINTTSATNLSVTSNVTVMAWVKPDSDGVVMSRRNINFATSVNFNDTFTRAANANVTDHTPTPIGSKWSEITLSTARGNIWAANDSVNSSVTGNSNGFIDYTNTTINSSDYNVSITVKLRGATDDSISIVARMLNANNYYAVKFSSTSGGYSFLYKRVASVCTVLNASNWTVAVNDRITFLVNGTSLKVYKNGVIVASATDNNLTQAGMAGFGLGRSHCYATDDTTTQNIDNFEVTYLAPNPIGFYLSAMGGGKFVVRDATGAYNASGSNALNDGTWHHVAGTYNGSDIKFYLDGAIKGTNTSYSGNLPNSTEVLVGFFNDSDKYYNGTLDELRVYKRCLNENEILMDYQSEFAKYNSTEYRFYGNVTGISIGAHTYYGGANSTAGTPGQTDAGAARQIIRAS